MRNGPCQLEFGLGWAFLLRELEVLEAAVTVFLVVANETEHHLAQRLAES